MSEIPLNQSRLLLKARPGILAGLGANESSFVSKFHLPDGVEVHTATSEINLDGECFYGHGRDLNPIIAVSKAFGENLERIFAVRFMNEDLAVSFCYQAVSVHGGQLTVSPGGVFSGRPPPGLFSSNGWAIQFSKDRSCRGAIEEVLERTILQATFMGAGWEAFEKVENLALQGRDLGVWLSKEKLFGFRAGIVECRLNLHPGRTFGYFLSSADSEFSWKRHLNGIMESLEPAVFLDCNPTYRPSESDAIALKQFQFARMIESDIFRSKKRGTLVHPHNFFGQLVTIDLTPVLNINFPFYLSWCFGGNSIPLILKSNMDPDSRAYVEAAISRYGLTPGEGYETPVF